jgi:putative two-component system response regulator
MFTDTSAPARKVGGTVLVVDDLAANLRLLERVLAAQGYRVVTASEGIEALAVVARAVPDVVVTDVRMPKCDGFELCRRMKSNPATRLTPVVLMTGASEADDRLRAIEAGADDFLTKPVDQAELKARVRSLVLLKRFTDDLDSAETVLRSLALMIEARDKDTEGHCERLARYAIDVGNRLRLPEEDLVTLGRGGYFHDIGKIALPDSILLKAGPLTEAERELMKQHPVVGDRLCGNLRVLHAVRPIVRHHHERLDGSGYPDRLRGDEVPLLAQIIGIVDAYDAMTTTRPYRAAMTPEEAFATLRDEAALGRFRPDLVEALIATRQGGGGV